MSSIQSRYDRGAFLYSLLVFIIMFALVFGLLYYGEARGWTVATYSDTRVFPNPGVVAPACRLPSEERRNIFDVRPECRVVETIRFNSS